MKTARTDGDVVLGRDQRDEIMKAVKAIESQVRALKPDWQALYVIGTNLTIIQVNVTGLARAHPN